MSRAERVTSTFATCIHEQVQHCIKVAWPSCAASSTCGLAAAVLTAAAAAATATALGQLM